MLAEVAPDIQVSWDWQSSPLVVLLLLCAALAGICIFFSHFANARSSRKSRGNVLLPESPCPSVAADPPPPKRPGVRPIPLAAVPPAESGSRDHRKALRRVGKPVKALVEGLAGAAGPTACWILDRSKGGICLLLAQPINVGVKLRVRASNAPEDAPWVPVEVRNCRTRGRRWKVGCRFQQDLPWGTLLLFG